MTAAIGAEARRRRLSNRSRDVETSPAFGRGERYDAETSHVSYFPALVRSSAIVFSQGLLHTEKLLILQIKKKKQRQKATLSLSLD